MIETATPSLREFLDRKVNEYNTPAFIEDDPVSVPHAFSQKQDIEIAGFFAALFSWGNRTTIINKSKELMARMDNAPYRFIRDHRPRDLKALLGFKHRTFNDTDLLYFVRFLHHHYNRTASLEAAFIPEKPVDDEGYDVMERSLIHFHQYFFSLEDAPARTRKHIASPARNSTCKRLNMFLRWMVRRDAKGVDFGLWKKLPVSELICPIDVHVARVATRFGLLSRRQTDWQAAKELTGRLRQFDPEDPVKYDYALFGLGVIEHF